MPDGDAGQDDGVAAQPNVAADKHIATRYRISANPGGLGDHRRKRVETDPIRTMMAAQEDFHILGYRRVAAQLERRAFLPVMDDGDTVGPQTNLILRIERPELRWSTIELG
jgi:hypothetical protein